MSENPSISIDRIAEITGLSRNRAERAINSLKQKGLVARIGGTCGTWAVLGRP